MRFSSNILLFLQQHNIMFKKTKRRKQRRMQNRPWKINQIIRKRIYRAMRYSLAATTTTTFITTTTVFLKNIKLQELYHTLFPQTQDKVQTHAHHIDTKVHEKWKMKEVGKTTTTTKSRIQATEWSLIKLNRPSRPKWSHCFIPAMLQPAKFSFYEGQESTKGGNQPRSSMRISSEWLEGKAWNT